MEALGLRLLRGSLDLFLGFAGVGVFEDWQVVCSPCRFRE